MIEDVIYETTSCIENIGRMTWDDFVPASRHLPCITISSLYREGSEAIEVDSFEYFAARDGWYDAYIPDFTEGNIKKIIAMIVVTVPEKIHLEWLCIAQAH